MADLSKYSDVVLQKLIMKMEIEEEEKMLSQMIAEVKNINTNNIIDLDGLNKAKDYLTYDIYDLFNIKKLPTIYKKDESVYNPINTAIPFVDYHTKLTKTKDILNIKDVVINEIKLKDVEF